MATTSSTFHTRSRRVSGQTDPESTSTTPPTGSSQSRSDSLVAPLNATDFASYGSTRPIDTGKGPAASESVHETPEESLNSSTQDTLQSRLPQLMNSNYSPYLLLENSGSVARDHLASERTFLAYVRTSLALSSAGVALVQLFSVASGENKEKFFRFARPLGAILVTVGILVLAIGFSRYFRIQAALISGQFPLARLSIFFVSSTTALLAAVVFGVLVHVVR